MEMRDTKEYAKFRIGFGFQLWVLMPFVMSSRSSLEYRMTKRPLFAI